MDEPDLREMYAQRAKNLGMTAEAHEAQILALTPLRKYAKHDEVAKAALFLASSDSSHTTGESLNVRAGSDESRDGQIFSVLQQQIKPGTEPHGATPTAYKCGIISLRKYPDVRSHRTSD